jgi:alpha-beta hydrolase superfamily lysophospholipase
MTPSSLPFTRRSRRASLVFESDGCSIFGMLHRPLVARAECPAVLLLHGFMADKCQPPHYLFVLLADALAEQGIVSLRIDLPGRGDSEGTTLDMTPQADLAAAARGMAALAAQPGVDSGRVALLGISWGGLLAALLAERAAAVALLSAAPGELVAWRPQLRQVEGRLVNEFVGNLIGSQFYEGLAALSPLAGLQKSGGPVLLLHGTDDESVPAGDIADAAGALRAAAIPVDVVAIAGADHIFFLPVWQRQVVATTVRWLAAALGTGGNA